uniref:porin n=1 Tax=Paraburkholderia phenoliruptrix TaxID=252970 RepID=UPI001592A876
MKTSLALIGAAACGFACAAQAQGSVTLYGIVDAGYRYNSNAGGAPQHAIVDGTERANNAIKYVSPRYRGLQLGATYSLGGVAGQVTRNEMISAGADYQQGPFKFAAAYLYVKNPNFALFGNNATSSETVNQVTS